MTKVIDGTNAVLGRLPMLGPASLSSVDSSLGPLVLGSNVIIGTSAVVYRGTKIGDYSYIADIVHIRESCHIGSYCSVGKCTSLEPKVIMEDRAKIAACSQIAALTELKKGCFVGADVSICTDTSFGRIKNADKKVIIEKGAMIGSNASIGPGVTIGRNAMVALGAVVLRNVPENKVAFGNPAKIMWDVDKKLQQKIKTASNYITTDFMGLKKTHLEAEPPSRYLI